MFFRLLLLLFFFSGACGLVYQVLWLRLLSLVFGVTVYAASTVLAAFMAGLALGSALAGRIVDRVGRPLLVFGVAEILIGLSALATPLAFDAASALYERLYQLSPGSLALLTIARLLAGFAVLLLPTMLMGLTLPVLSSSHLVPSSTFGSHVSALYAVNTAGAVTGAVLTGFYLIGAIGIERSFLLAAGINIAVGGIAILIERGLERSQTFPTIAAPTIDGTSRLRAVNVPIGIVVLISGLVALALEIVWFRMLVQYLTATTYAFTTMLATVLAGIALGGAIAGRLLRRNRDWIAWLAVIQIATACATLGSAIFLGWSYAAGWRTSGDIQASAAAILPVTLLMGISFPIAIRIAASPSDGETPSSIARRVGRLYSLNVIGAIAGALIGGFLLLPLLGSRQALIALAAAYGTSAVVLIVSYPRRGRLLGVLAAGVAAFAVLAPLVPDPFVAAYHRRYGSDMREYWREDGIQTAVSVHASQFRRSLYLDGLHQANDTPDMVKLHRIIGHLPMVLHPDRPLGGRDRSSRKALVIGLGGGATSGAVSQHATSVQIVELSDSVRHAAQFFAHVNYDVLNQPNVRIRVDDGRNFLALSGEKFDVITADIIQPIHAGAGNLYSREYFTLVRNALEPGGVALQWIGHRPPTMYRLIMRTFLDVFPHATLWLAGNLMVGSLDPLHVQEAQFAAKRADPRTAAALDEVGLTSFDVLKSWYTAGPDDMRRFVGEGPVLTDDRPLLEYHRSLPSDDRPLDLSELRGDIARIAQ